MSETDKLKVEMYDDVVKEKNKEYIELTCRFRETCNDIKNKDKEIERLNNVIDKKEQFLGDNIKRLEREVVKRDNIINELEKYLIEQVEKSYSNDYDNVLDKLDELKGSDKE